MFSCYPPSTTGHEGNPAVAAAAAWGRENHDGLPNCRPDTTGCAMGTCSVGRTILLTSMLEELAGADRRERAQSESSTRVRPSENILPTVLPLLLSGGAAVLRTGWRAEAGASSTTPVAKFISPSCRKGKRRPSLA